MAYIPDNAVLTSPTAVQGQADQKDFFVYGSGVLVNAGSGELTLFTTSISQAINKIGAYSIANPPPAQYLQHSTQTTNLVEPSKFGSLGDGDMRALGVWLDQAAIDPLGAGQSAIRTWGATAWEVKDILSKVSLLFKIATKEELQAPVGMFPAPQGAVGSLSTTANNVTNDISTNGVPGVGKQFRFQPRITRVDTITAKLTVAAQSVLEFQPGRVQNEVANSGNSGQPVLAQVVLLMSMDQDRR